MSIKEILQPYQERVENALKKALPHFGKETPLQKACLYALSHGGKRVRPALVYMVADALRKNLNVDPAALAIEYLHTASLIADDLPCMDNDALRRGNPSTHIAFGESTALLSSYSFMAAGYAAIAENTENLRTTLPEADYIGILALKYAAHHAGIQGATTGQYLDLFPPTQDLETYLETALKKTVTFFQIAMLFGWLFGGGNPSHISTVQQAAYHFGLAFQMADDFDDAIADAQENRTMNIVTLLGYESALSHFHTHITNYKKCLEELYIASPHLLAIADYLVSNLKLAKTEIS